MTTCSAGRELDVQVAERVFGRVVPGTCCAIYVEGEWSLHPDSRPEGWSCYAGIEPVMVEHCSCWAGYARFPDDELEDMKDFKKRRNDQWRNEWDADQTRWGHSRRCLAVVPHYSTNIESAWTVIEHMQARGWGHRHLVHSPAAETPGWDWQFMKPGGGLRSIVSVTAAATAPLAICRAALQAAGISLKCSN